MSLQLGLIVLPTDTAELNKVLEALSKLGVATSAVTTTTGKGKTTAKEEPEVQTEKLKPVTADQVKAVMTKVRDELGDDIISELLTAFGAEKLKDVDKSDWAALVAAAEAALGNGGSGEDDDGFGLDDDDDGEELDAEEVKVSVQAYAKKHGKEKAQAILVKNGLNTVRGLASADQKTLAAIAKAVK